MRLPLTIDGVDFSDAANRLAYVVGYTVRTGSNGGTMLSGLKRVDNLARKAVITWELNALSAENLKTLLNAVSADTVEVKFYDTMLAAERTATFIPTISEAAAKIVRTNRIWFNGMKLTLEEA